MSEADPVWKEKREFIEKHGMVVWRFHDHWHRKARRNSHGDDKRHGLGEISAGRKPYLFTMPERTLEALAAEVAKEAGFAGATSSGRAGMKVTQLVRPGSSGCARTCAGVG